MTAALMTIKQVKHGLKVNHINPQSRAAKAIRRVCLKGQSVDQAVREVGGGLTREGLRGFLERWPFRPAYEAHKSLL